MPIVPRAPGGLIVGAAGVTPALPAATALDDILLLCIETANQAVSVANAAGGTWTEVPNSPQGIGTAGAAGATRLTVFWSRYNGSQTAPTTSDSGEHNAAFILGYSGCITTGDPVDVTAGDTQAATTAGSIPGATTTVDACMVVAIAATDLDASGTNVNASGWTNASLASITERFDQTSATGGGGGFAVADGIKTTAGVVSATTWTQANSAALANIMVALKPPAAIAPQTLSGSLFTSTPAFSVGVLTASFTLAGVLFAKAPTFPTGTLSHVVVPPTPGGNRMGGDKAIRKPPR